MSASACRTCGPSTPNSTVASSISSPITLTQAGGSADCGTVTVTREDGGGGDPDPDPEPEPGLIERFVRLVDENLLESLGVVMLLALYLGLQ